MSTFFYVLNGILKLKRDEIKKASYSLGNRE